MMVERAGPTLPAHGWRERVATLIYKYRDAHTQTPVTTGLVWTLLPNLRSIRLWDVLRLLCE